MEKLSSEIVWNEFEWPTVAIVQACNELWTRIAREEQAKIDAEKEAEHA